MIADVDVANIGPDGFDDPSTFVTEDQRPRSVQGAVEIVVVAVAQACGDRPHQDLTADGSVVSDIGDVEQVGIVTQYGGTH